MFVIDFLVVCNQSVRRKTSSELEKLRSARRQSAALNLSLTSMRRILHEYLRFHPHKIKIVNQLCDTDKPARLAFCREFSEMLNADPDILNKLIMSNEACFHLSGFVNKQNFRYWNEDQPMQVHEQPLHSEKMTLWCDVSVSESPHTFFKLSD
ncbi:hypothetical protein ANN_14628 [Periplaneta americana]|uniref:Uncharacterized protein n=1 Tax=Periplaneta americana TaxID=6978 RepID=A0ABQ8SY21_PERAM|nr:hypothetical protein ANN_14628 [Periplaneta americana]